MCGRFVSATPPDQVAAYFGAELAADPLPANFNIAPTNEIYAVVETPTGPQLQVFHWGLVPHWAKERKIGQKMINARAETVAEKPAFKSILRKYRCIIPADGFYEWQAQQGVLTKSGKPAKQPMFIHRLDGEPLAFAGLWSVWTDTRPPCPRRAARRWRCTRPRSSRPPRTPRWRPCTTACPSSFRRRAGRSGSTRRTTTSTR
jgi:putative SOS response-associated peptidase YedK